MSSLWDVLPLELQLHIHFYRHCSLMRTLNEKVKMFVHLIDTEEGCWVVRSHPLWLRCGCIVNRANWGRYCYVSVAEKKTLLNPLRVFPNCRYALSYSRVKCFA